jgi:hypothetical protein
MKWLFFYRKTAQEHAVVEKVLDDHEQFLDKQKLRLERLGYVRRERDLYKRRRRTT